MIGEIDQTTKSLIDGILIMLDHVNAENEELQKELKLYKKDIRESNDVYVDQLKRIAELEEFVRDIAGLFGAVKNHSIYCDSNCIGCRAKKLLSIEKNDKMV